MITDLKRRCDRGYLSFAFNPNMSYLVQGRYGGCTLQVDGTAGTHVTVTLS